MPLYDFQCKSCGAISEFFLKMSDPPPAKCKACGEGPVTKLLSAPNFHLKGGGWFADGYDGKSNQTKKPKKSGDTSSKSTPKTDTPPAT